MAVDGTWNVTVSTPMGEQQVTVNLTAAGAALTGTLTNPAGSVPIEDGTVNGNDISFKAHVTSPFSMTLNVAGTVNGDAISGNVKTMFGSSPFTGKKA